MAAATIVHDTSEAVELCPPYGLYLKPITKMTISVALPQLKQPGKSISNWEVMERLKGMVHNHQFSTLRISKSTMDFIRFEGEVENKSLVRSFLACLDGKTIKLSGFSDILKVRAAEFKIDFPTRHDWDSFFRDAKDMNETLPGERPDTIHLEGLPCKWFALKESGSEKPSEGVLVRVFERFGEIRNVDIPMLDPYREEMTGRNFHTFSFGGHLNFEAYVQYREYAGFIQAMSALRGMKLMYKGEDGKAVACNIKVSFDSTKHLSDASIKKRQLERQKLQELEQQREEQKRREKEAEERQRAEERKQKELEAQERERKREEKLRRREQKQRDRELRRSQKQLEKLQAEAQRKLQEKIRLEERKLLLAQRNLQSLRLVAELLSRAKVPPAAPAGTRGRGPPARGGARGGGRRVWRPRVAPDPGPALREPAELWAGLPASRPREGRPPTPGAHWGRAAQAPSGPLPWAGAGRGSGRRPEDARSSPGPREARRLEPGRAPSVRSCRADGSQRRCADGPPGSPRCSSWRPGRCDQSAGRSVAGALRPVAACSCFMAVKLRAQEQQEETLRLQQQEERRRLQEAELRRVEEEKERALGLQRRERELRERLLSILLSKKADGPRAPAEPGASHAHLLQPVLDMLHTVSAGCAGAAPPTPTPTPSGPPEAPPPPPAAGPAPAPAPAQSVNGSAAEEEAASKEGQHPRRVGADDGPAEKRCPGVLACIPDNNQQPKAAPAACEQSAPRKDARSEQDKCNREPSGGRGRASGDRGSDDRPKRERSRPRRAGSREDARPHKERRPHRKRSHQGGSPRRRSASPEREREHEHEHEHGRSRRSHSGDRHGRRERSRDRDRRGSSGRRRSRHRRSERSRSGSPSRHRSTWNRRNT
ncbi:A-kinase anchor protein 17A-like isoform X2 [Eubalaena glacialis]|uniref:A-kinase anchor protein 17A-like isoform X2 n=1 Tax=Eubalaena glacialis TaxID=27606 RepID=UPI002A5AC819|nr:A-kinase anchor protein 17A-like isoform X2 [Eubalaena glacialis]XP_061035573.1 A-kinase anchor protein 17A-like isoform X2 [Eubalaena glacialis]